MKNQYDISIANVLIRIIYTENKTISPLAAEAFYEEIDSPDIVLNIQIVEFAKPIIISQADVKTSAWEMKNEKDVKIFNFFDKNFSIATLIMAKDFSQGEIKISASALHDVIPPLFVMVPILSGFLLKNKRGILFHGAIINLNGEGILLTGASGAGKSTLSELFKSKGYRKIGDDRLILTIDQKNDAVMCYSTPFDLKLTNWVNDKIQLKAIIRLSHSLNGQNNIEKCKMSKEIGSLILSNFMPIFAPEYMSEHFQLCETIFSGISLYQYSFVPDYTSVKYIEEFFINEY